MNTGNEVELIRAQLTAERQHASTVANACATAFGRRNAVALSSGSSLEEFQQACVDYLVRVLAWFEERDQRLRPVARTPDGRGGGPAHTRGHVGEPGPQPRGARETRSGPGGRRSFAGQPR